MRYLLISLVLLSACGKPPTTAITVDSQLTPYFQRFTNTLGVSADGISASFQALPYPTLGQCEMTADLSIREIKVDPSYWANASDDAREQLIFHELGHCAMYLAHIATVNPDGCPTSIMFPYAFGDSPCYSIEKQQYFQELESLH